MTPSRLPRALASAWVVVLSILLAGPALAPGFALSYDLVFTPRQELLPGAFGVGGGLPRAVPQDAVVALVEMVVPGSVLEKVVLVGIGLLTGFGMMRLLGRAAAGVVGATIAMVSPYLLQRLVIGHWGLLLAYALVPWAIAIAARYRRAGDPWDALRLVLLAGAAALTPSGAILLAAIAIPPVILPGSTVNLRRRILVCAAVLATWLPWAIPSLIHPSALAQFQGADVFALRAEGAGGPLLSALAGGGIWNAEAVLPSRATALSWVLALIVLALAASGAPALVRLLGRATTMWWGIVAVAGLTCALVSAWFPGPWQWLLGALPGGGLLRDSHKLLAPWVLLTAAAAGCGAAWVIGRLREPSARWTLLGALVVMPLALQPDALWGAGGRLVAVSYPDDWSRVREAISADSRPGDVASFPWTAFRRFDWNDGRTVLDPAPRWLTRPTVVSDDLAVQTSTGVIVVPGDDPRARGIGDALEAGRPLGEVLVGLGIGWALVAEGTPGPTPDLPGWDRVVDGETLVLYAAPGGAIAPRSAGLPLVVAVDALVFGGLMIGLGALTIRRVRRVRARGAGPLVR